MDTQYLIAKHMRHLGSIPGCIALNAVDVGEARLEDGSLVTITWGRNLDAAQVVDVVKRTTFQPVQISSHPDAVCELILPEPMATKLRAIISPANDSRPADWVDHDG